MPSDIIYKTDLTQKTPPLREAERELLFSVASVRARGGHLLKLRHGDALSTGLRRFLRSLRQEGKIRFFVPGEELGGDEPGAIYLAETFPAVALDPELSSASPGLTVICL